MSCLSFHHRDPSIKEFPLDMRHCSAFSMERLKKEASKCSVLCMNCHGEEHIPEHNDWKKNNPWEGKVSFSEEEEEKRKRKREERKRLKKEKKKRIYRREKNLCLDCSKKISHSSKRCSKCMRKTRIKITWPPAEALREEVLNSNYVKVAKRLGVSDNAIRKHLKKAFGSYPNRKDIQAYKKAQG